MRIHSTMIAEYDTYETNQYRDRSFLSRLFLGSTLSFYPQILKIVLFSGHKAKQGRYTRADWIKSSEAMLRSLENVGVHFSFSGMNHMREVNGPVVFISNHMSTLETVILPCIIEPVKTCTFVVKNELLTYPVFGHVMRAVNPIAVSRDNPKEDFVTVMDEGVKKIQDGFSVIIFPQTTRTTVFSPEDFNSLGIKLAVRAQVPVLPIALKTDAWGNGRKVKEFGKIDPSNKVHIAFGEAIPITGRGTGQHQKVIEFISQRMDEWSGKGKS